LKLFSFSAIFGTEKIVSLQLETFASLARFQNQKKAFLAGYKRKMK